MESLVAEDDLVVDQAQTSPNLSKMTTTKSEEKSSEFKKYVKGLLQCTVCIKLIKTIPIHQCTDGHVVCKDCIPKLNNFRVRDGLFFHFRKVCPTCKNHTTLSRNLIIEQIIEKLDEIQPENEEAIEMPKIKKSDNGFTVANFLNNESDSLLISVDKDDESNIELEEKSSELKRYSNFMEKEMIELEMESLLAEDNLVVDQVLTSLNLSKITTSKSEENSSEFEKYVEDLLECPVCLELIKTTPILQCAEGHVICKDCIPKLYHCPICRNYSKLSRNLIIEQIIENFHEIQPESKELIEKPKIQKWAKRPISAKFLSLIIILGVILGAILEFGFIHFVISVGPKGEVLRP